MNCESRAIDHVAARLDEKIVDVLNELHSVAGRLIFTGIGKMGCIGRKAAATFCSTGTPAIFLHSAEAAHGDLGIVTREDVVIALSYSGQTEELLFMLPYMQRFDVPVVCITGNPESELAKHSSHVIDIRVANEADHNGLAPTASTTVALAVCDSLAIALAKKRGFTAEQFAIFHPRGNLGRKLLMTTSSIMHHSGAIPFAHPKMLLRDAIVVMSAKRLGALIVVNDETRLLGIVTDGDIRRVLQRHENPLQHEVATVMTVDPAKISTESLAAEALRIIQEKEISVLPVIDEQNYVCGIVHLHDLIKSGLA